MVQLSIDEDFLLVDKSKKTLLAQEYVNEESFRFSSETYKKVDKGADKNVVNKLFKGRYKIEASVKRSALKSFIPAAVPYMSIDQRDYWHSLYSKMFISVLHDYNLLCVLDRKQKLPDLKKELDQYVKYLELIESYQLDKNDYQADFLASNEKWQPIFYVGFSLFNWFGEPADVNWFSEQAKDFKAAPNVFVRDWITELNWHRLYWVWAGGAGGFLGSILDLDYFSQMSGRDQASQNLESPDKYLGYASWVFYGARLSLHFALLLKHTIPNPLMSDEEKSVDFLTRLCTQIEQRKDKMGNDFVWGIINYISLYWYTSSISPVSGAIGGGFNILLMLFDYYMAYTKFNEKLLEFETAEQAILKKIKDTNKKLARDLKDDKKKVSLERLIITLNQDLAILRLNWQFEEPILTLTKNLTLAFVVAMALMFAPIFPVIFPALVLSATVLNNLVFIGCVMSVLLTAYESYFDYQMDYGKSLLLSTGVEVKLLKLLHKHNSLVQQEVPDVNNQLRLLHLENKRLSTELLEHQAQMKLTSALQIHSLISQFMFPAIVFGSLFLSAPLAITIIASGIFTAMISRALIVHNYTVKSVNNDDIKLTKEEFKTPQLSFFYHKDVVNKIIPEKEVDKAENNFGIYGVFSVAASHV